MWSHGLLLARSPHLKRLFAACAGSTFEARRDTGLLMLLLDTGARRTEMTGLTLDDLDLDLDVLVVLGKGRRERTLPFGRRAGEALDRTCGLARAISTPRCRGCGWGRRAG
jgi:site-specific recombinase XerD